MFDKAHSVLRAGLFAAAVAVSIALGGCADEPDADALRRIMGEMETAVESGETGDFLEHVSDNFLGQSGAVDMRQLRVTLLAIKMRHERIGIVPGDAEIEVSGDRASVKIRVLATGGSWMPETGQILDIVSQWQREEGEWRCISADWTGNW
jgi:hypothetical protein